MSSIPSELEKSSTELAVIELSKTTHQLAMRWIVLDIAVRETIATLPADLKVQFAARFRESAQSTMHHLADKLIPIDDAEISASVRRFLEAAFTPPKGSDRQV